MECKIIETLINSYVNNAYKSQSDEECSEDEEILIEAAKNKLFQDVKHEIVESEKVKMREEIKKEFKSLEQKRKLKELKTLMYEGFFIAFLVGLIVNQVTEMINITKGIETKVTITLLIIFILGILNLFVYKTKFLGDFYDSVEFKEE